ncbi:putative periplasmic serine endoprotease DegP-like precursor [Anaerohalosphaera lusitana]|uniref:Putative periplasmic serine endoprotease DegP-like n=1 Tax=Anaerohalosphaera lusitana TaxID=1936003 RepID=A0A1U9NQE1_9BACT|nr:S1C family serine protease [Anaerohalosphaera lusitana]AQT69997.1 putative periplasmic serine endoprotease DegP-like precursor [Anaerohalosphaera lusitana]
MSKAKWTPRAIVLFIFFLTMLTGLISLTILAPATADNTGPDTAESSKQSPDLPQQNLYDHVAPASVEILVDGRLAGSGCFVAPTGLVITAEHVLAHPDRRIEVITNTRDRIPASVVAVNCAHDLALLQVDSDRENFPYLPIAEKTPPASTPAYVFGAPVFRHGVMLAGRVARNQTAFEWYGSEKEYIEIIHFSALAPQGMSGGPWFDSEGQLIGIQSGGMVLDGGHVGISFVAPARPLRELVKNKKTVQTPTLAIACEEMWEQGSNPLKNGESIEGLIVRIVCEPGPSFSAGLKPDDIITAVEGEKVRYRDELLHAVRSRKTGQTVNLTVISPDNPEPRDVDVTLTALEKEWLDKDAEQT